MKIKVESLKCRGCKVVVCVNLKVFLGQINRVRSLLKKERKRMGDVVRLIL